MQKTAQSLLAFLIAFLLIFTLAPLVPASAYADDDEMEIVVEEYNTEIGPIVSSTGDPQVENSYRFENGVRLSSEDGARTEDQNLLSTFSVVTNPEGNKVYDWFDKFSNGYYTGTNAFKGIDVSQHNGVIDWAKVKASGVNYAIIRCGYGQNSTSQDDKQWLNNVKGCIAQGIPFGVYIYSYATNATRASGEADHVLRCLKDAGLNPAKLGYPVYFDMEDKSTENADHAAMATEFCTKIKNAGYTPGIYASKSWFENKLTNSCFENWTKWVAAWNTTVGLSYKGLSNFTSGNGMWQFSDYGKVPGINDHAVDLDYTFMKPAYNVAFANYSYSGMIHNVTGGQLSPDVTVTLDGKRLTNGTDYKIYYKKSGSSTSTTTAPSAAGTYEVIVVGDGRYSGSKSLGNMTIVAKPNIDTSMYCRITSASNGDYVLDAAGATPSLGSNVSIWTKNGGDNQLWKFEFDNKTGYYTIRNIAKPEYVLDASGARPGNGANISVWKDNGGLNQKWIASESNGSFKFRNAGNGDLSLDASGAQPKLGANVTAWKDNTGDNQKWKLTYGNNLELAKVSATGLVRNTTGQELKPASVTVIANGKILTEGSDYEVRYGGQTTKPSKAGSYTVSIVGKGSYTGSHIVGKMQLITPPSLSTTTKYQLVSSSGSGGLVLDAAGAIPHKGSNVSLWTENNGNNQKWYFMHDGKGFYTIKNAADQDLILDAASATPKLGSNISVWEDNEGLNQKWVIEVKDGYCIFRNAANPDLVLDASGVAPGVGANVTAWSCNYGKNQKWELHSAT